MSFNIEEHRAKLPAAQADVIRATLPLVGQNIDMIAKVFYDNLFTAHPELLSHLFNRGNQKQGAQQRALAASIATFASVLVNPEAEFPEAMFSRIAHKHASLGVVRPMYQIVHDTLFPAIIEVLGADVVSKEVAEAWGTVYWILADMLVGCETKLYTDEGVEPGDVFRKATVIDRMSLNGGVIFFRVEAVDKSRPFSGHLAGQYISVRARLPDGAGQLRQYSLVDDGVKPGQLCFAVRAVPGDDKGPAGEVSNWLAQHVNIGDELEVSLPFGDLVLKESEEPIVLISAGIGITPMLGMLSRLAADKTNREVLALHVDRNPQTDAFANERVKLTAELPSGKAKTWYREGDRTPGATVGKMDLADMELTPDAHYYLCGSSAFLKASRDALEKQDIPERNVNFELFSPNDWLK
ncbi:hypothetical protein MSPP1_002857 [Malassezia sp. CBS 17886]|nr:hypothetical protein MSPP1_002857 [Malassezia sp. CBS 17886]